MKQLELTFHLNKAAITYVKRGHKINGSKMDVSSTIHFKDRVYVGRFLKLLKLVSCTLGGKKIYKGSSYTTSKPVYVIR